MKGLFFALICLLVMLSSLGCAANLSFRERLDNITQNPNSKKIMVMEFPEKENIKEQNLNISQQINLLDSNDVEVQKQYNAIKTNGENLKNNLLNAANEASKDANNIAIWKMALGYLSIGATSIGLMQNDANTRAGYAGAATIATGFSNIIASPHQFNKNFISEIYGIVNFWNDKVIEIEMEDKDMKSKLKEITILYEKMNNKSQTLIKTYNN